MSNQLNDLWVEYLKSEGYGGGQYNDLIREALQDQTGSSKKQINDLWKEYLGSLGFSSQYSWLGDKGYEGSLNDRMKLALEGGDVFSVFSSFGPSMLFNNGEEGAWYDPSDLSTLFKDAAGTDPVTADGDPVGLMLDKSQGLELGLELITNGDFDSASGWSLPRGTISGGVLTSTAAGSGSIAETAITLAEGSIIDIVVDVKVAVTGAQLFVGLLGGSNPLVKVPDSVGLHNLRLRADSDNPTFRFASGGGSGSEGVEIESVSVKELLGNHASQSVTGAKPIYRTDGTLHWLETDGTKQLRTSSINPLVNEAFFSSSFSKRAFGTANWGHLFQFNDGVNPSGGFGLRTPLPAGAADGMQFRMDAGVAYTSTPSEYTTTDALTASGIFADGSLFLRVDGAVEAADTYGAYTLNNTPLNLFGRGPGETGAGQYNLYGFVLRFADTEESDVLATEQYLAAKSGVTL